MNIKMLCALVLTLGILAAALLTACSAETELKIENESLTDIALSYTVSSNEPLAGTLICAVYDANRVLRGIEVVPDTLAVEYIKGALQSLYLSDNRIALFYDKV